MGKTTQSKRKKEKIVRTPSKGPFIFYALFHTHCDKTYSGQTNNWTRRLRQHRGEIAGGARYTHSMVSKEGTWNPLFHVIGFGTKRAVLQYELAMKRRKVPVAFRPGSGASPAERKQQKKAYTRGPAGRVRQLEYLLSLGKITDEPHSPFRDNGISVHVHVPLNRYLAFAGITNEQFDAVRARQGVKFKFV